MIFKVKDMAQTELAFGSGDICVNGGYILDNDKRIGLVLFSNQLPREIRAMGDIQSDTECELRDFPIIMTFTNPESIDIIVEQLLYAKQNMKDK